VTDSSALSVCLCISGIWAHDEWKCLRVCCCCYEKCWSSSGRQASR